jgi:hypothetical protein
MTCGQGNKKIENPQLEIKAKQCNKKLNSVIKNKLKPRESPRASFHDGKEKYIAVGKCSGILVIFRPVMPGIN